MGHGDLFSKSHSNFCQKSRTPPFPQIDGLEQILKPNATTKNPFRGCSPMKFKASLTFHKRSAYVAFKKRSPCPCFTSIKAKVWDSSKGRIFRIKPLRLLPRTESWSAVQRSNGIPVLQFQQTAGRDACSLGVDADWRRVPCQAFLLA